ncbi:uncharacterized protein LOC124938973 [Impatiens glandulifera]|uniref:uncharacterized protein LOC124938973 n=1 Tax=Impatiens glandulifera TaxID=253017 RepID=UPI001FB1982F|nr:uncharacterized protein LOC124938973 [Impatiens glandulifera]
MSKDDSFKRPGSIPFKWEIRPGVPKTQLHRYDSPSRNLHRSLINHHHHQQALLQPTTTTTTTVDLLSCPNTPPARFETLSPVWNRSIKSAPQTPFRRSKSRSVEPNTIVRLQPEIVGTGCLSRDYYYKKREKRNQKKRSSDSDCSSCDIESVSRLSSESSRRSVSPLSSSEFSSHWSSSPREIRVRDSDWAGFGLF